MIKVPRELFDRVLELITFAVHEHVQDNGIVASLRTDSGWEDAYEVMEQLEQLIDD